MISLTSYTISSLFSLMRLLSNQSSCSVSAHVTLYWSDPNVFQCAYEITPVYFSICLHLHASYFLRDKSHMKNYLKTFPSLVPHFLLHSPSFLQSLSKLKTKTSHFDWKASQWLYSKYLKLCRFIQETTLESPYVFLIKRSCWRHHLLVCLSRLQRRRNFLRQFKRSLTFILAIPHPKVLRKYDNRRCLFNAPND